MATTRRNSRNLPAQRPNPIRELLAEKQRAAELVRSRLRVQQLKSDLPALIDNQVGEHIHKLETKLLKDFKEFGERAIEESTTVLNEQLGSRIDTLEQVSAIQSETLMQLRDSSMIADQKVSAVVSSIERSLSGAVPGFKLDAPAYAPQAPSVAAPAAYQHAQFQLEARTEIVKADTQEVSETDGKLGFCPSCTSTNVRRANRSGLFEEFLRLFFIAPFRCRACRHKFYQF